MVLKQKVGRDVGLLLLPSWEDTQPSAVENTRNLVAMGNRTVKRVLRSSTPYILLEGWNSGTLR